MSKLPAEASSRWEVRRGYYPVSRSLIAAREILWLAVMSDSLPFTEIDRPVRYFGRTSKLTVVQTGVSTYSRQESRRQKTLDHHPEYWQGAAELRALYDRSSVDTNDRSGGFLGHIYEVGGRIGWHKDRADLLSTDDSLSVNLYGNCRVWLRDDMGCKVWFDLDPGDAVYLNNDGMPHERPPHRFVNTGHQARISFVD